MPSANHNHQSEQHLQQWNAELEQRVQERTAQLEAANTALLQELLAGDQPGRGPAGQAGEAAAGQAVRLQGVTAALSEAVTVAEVADVILHQGIQAVGAQSGFMMRLAGDDGQTLELVQPPGCEEGAPADYEQLPLSAPVPAAEAARTGEPLWLESSQACLARYPHLAEIRTCLEHEAMAVIALKVQEQTLGVVGWNFAEARSFSPADQEFLLALAGLCAQALERAGLYEAEAEARTEAEVAQLRLAYLAEASRILSSSLDYETTLTQLMHLAVPALADQCFVHILTEDGLIQRVLALYADPAKETLARECERFYPPHSAFQDHPVVKVIQTGQTIFMPEIPDALLQKLARDAGQLARLRELGIKSAAVIPLTAHGQTFGAISLIWAGSGRCCAPADLATIEELARRAALALDNARLYREAQAEIAARKQAEQQLEASLQEKQILLKEVYHRVKNNLQAVSNLLFLQAEQIKDQHVREIFYEAQERVNSIALVHEKLYQTEDLSRVSFGEYLHSLASHLVRSNHARDRGVRLEIKSAEVQLDMETAIPLGIIINELVSNAFKHAFPADQARLADQADEIRIELRLETDRTLRLTVRDNGVGFPKGLEPANSGSLGLQLVHMLVQQLDGCLEFRRQKRGTLFQIKLNRQL